jgi:hypothetical protein
LLIGRENAAQSFLYQRSQGEASALGVLSGSLQQGV